MRRGRRPWDGASTGRPSLGHLDPSWGAARRFQLIATIAGPDVAAGLGLLLSQWRDHLAAVPGSGAG